MHALRSTDYPLPSAYNRALDASARLVFEDDPALSKGTVKNFYKTGEYPKGDSLKNHLDPRTYAYLRKVFSLWGIPEGKYSSIRPWYLVLTLSSPELHGLSNDLGVESFLEKRARSSSKPISGLESFREHMEVFSGLTDRQCEMLILMTFIPQETGGDTDGGLMNAWRHGDADTLARHRARFLPRFSLLRQPRPRRAQSKLGSKDRGLSAQRTDLLRCCWRRSSRRTEWITNFAQGPRLPDRTNLILRFVALSAVRKVINENLVKKSKPK